MNALPLFPGLRPWDEPETLEPIDWLEEYRRAAAEADFAGEMVRDACERYKADRSLANRDSYACADRAYDAARFRFQSTSYRTVTGIRSIAGLARHFELADAGRSRLI